jgi:hypothetical protein
MKKKKSHTTNLSEEEAARLEETLDLISARGPDPGRVEGYVESLKGLLMRSPRLALALVERLGGVKTRASGELLQEIAGLFPDKKYKRAVKKGLYRLKCAGCLEEVSEERESEDARRVLVKAPEPLEPAALVSRVDSTGALALMVVLPAGGEHRIGLFVIDAGAGIRSLENAEARRSRAEKVLTDFSREEGLDAEEIPLAHAAHLVGFGLDVAEERGAVPPPGSRELFDRLQEVSGSGPASHVAAIEEGEGAAIGERLRDSEKVAAWETFRTYLLPRDAIMDLAERLKNVNDSPIVLPGASQAALKDDIVRDALGTVFTADAKRDLLFRLRECGVHSFLRGERDDALAALAAARDLTAQEGPSTENLFCMSLVERSLAAAGADAGERPEEKGGGLIEIP